MRFQEIIRISYRFLSARWGRTFLTFFGIFLGSFLLVLFLAFSEGLKRHIVQPIEAKLRANILVVTPDTPLASGVLSPFRLFQRRNGVSESQEQFVRSLPEVAAVEEEIRIPFPVATSAEIILGISFAFDTTLSGFSEAAVNNFLPEGQTFSGEEGVVPVLLSPILVEVYNSTLAEFVPGAEKKTLEDFIGKKLEFTFGKINYLTPLANFPEGVIPQARAAEVVGFAPFLAPFTFAIPEKLAREMRRTYDPSAAEGIFPHALLVSPHAPSDIPMIQEKLRQQKLSGKDLSDNLESVRTGLFGLELLLSFTAGAILLLSFLFLAVVLLLNVAEHRKSIGILRALGASQGSIRNIFLFQGGAIAGGGIIFGTLLAFLLALFLDRILLSSIPKFSLTVPSFFLFDSKFFLPVLLMLFLAGLICAFFPAARAARLSPADALRER